MMHNSIALTLALPLALALACGDDDGSSSGGDGDGDGSELPASSGVDATAKTNELAVADIQKLCTYANKRFDGIDEKKICAASGAVSTQDSNSCKAFAQLCESAGDIAQVECSMLTKEELSGCDETVGTIEDCLKEEGDAAAHFAATTTCDDAGKVEPPSPSAMCQDVQSKCAALTSMDDVSH
jgi:hypothetical protein